MFGRLRRARSVRLSGCLLALAITLAVTLAVTLAPAALYAQDGGAQAGGYTVAPGDTLGAIAQRFGVTVDALVAANGLADPNLLRAGQVLAIPGADGQAISMATGDTGTVPDAASAAPPAITYSGEVRTVTALPGEALATLAQRYQVDAGVVAGLNSAADGSQRLFPGEPVQVPVEALQTNPLYFGVVIAVDVTPAIVQGRTGRVLIETSRPVALTGTWQGQPIVFTPIDDEGRRQFALLPVPALQDPGVYELVVGYTTTRGAPVARTWQIEVQDGGYESQQIVVSDDKAAQMTPEAIAAEREKVVSLWSQVSPTLLWQGPFLRPVDPQYATTSPFGTRRDYSVADIGNFHAGQDFGAPEGVLITAPAAGVVVLAEPVTVRGNAVILDHGRGIFTGYWHMSEIVAQVGQQVAPGDVLGIVGNTGLSTGAHLHWEMRINGVAVDPTQFLDEGPYPDQP